MLRLIARRTGTFTMQENGIYPDRNRAFITFGKQSSHAKQCGDLTKPHVFVIYWLFV